MEEQIPLYGTPGLIYKVLDTNTSLVELRQYFDNTDRSIQNIIQPQLPFAILTGIDDTYDIDYDKIIYVASEFHDLPVKAMAHKAILNNTQIQRLYITDNTVFLGRFCIAGCPYLQEIRFPSLIKWMGPAAINGCPSLKHLKMEYVEFMFKKSIGDLTQIKDSYPQTKYHIPQTREMTLDINSALSNNIQISDTKNNVVAIRMNSSQASGFFTDNRYNSTKYVRIIGPNISPDNMNASPNILNANKGVEWIEFEKGCTEITRLPLFSNENTSLKRIIFNDVPHFTLTGNLFQDGANCSNVDIYFCIELSEPKKSEFETYFSNLPDDKKPKIHYYEKEDWDFIGFTFNGYHSIRDLKIYRVSNGKLQKSFCSTIKNTTQQTDSINGTLYFGSKYDKQQVQINFAFDDLSESDLKKLQKALTTTKICPLIFDEEPYKQYEAKISGNLELSYVPFGKDEYSNIYKGQGSITFVCYLPFAHTPEQNFALGEKIVESYNLTQNYTYAQWKDESNLPSIFEYYEGQNYGEMATPFIARLRPLKNGNVNSYRIVPNTIIKVGPNQIKILEECVNLEWNSRTGMVTAQRINDKGAPVERTPIFYEGNSICTLPIKTDIPDKDYILPKMQFQDGSDVIIYYTELEYQFWYY